MERSVLMFLTVIYSAQLQKLKYSERAYNYIIVLVLAMFLAVRNRDVLVER